MRIVAAPWPQPISATLAPRSSRLDDAAECGKPFRHEVHAVVGAKGALGAAEQAIVVLVPADSLASAEALRDAGPAVHHRSRGLENPGHRDRTRLVGEHERVLGGQRVAVLTAVVGHEAACGLRVEPLTYIALVRVGASGEFAGANGLGVGHRTIEAELVADGDERSVKRGADLGGDLAGECLDTTRVECLHGVLLRVQGEHRMPRWRVIPEMCLRDI
jgi:hypothetical protein